MDHLFLFKIKTMFKNLFQSKNSKIKSFCGLETTQKARVISIFRAYKKPLTPSKVHEVYVSVFGDVHLTSIRREMTRLSQKGSLKLNGSSFNAENEWILNIQLS